MSHAQKDTICIMVIAPNDVVQKMGGNKNACDTVLTAIDNINKSFENSGINGYVKLVYINSWNSGLTGSMYDILNGILSERTDEMKTIHQLRRDVAADIAVIILDDPLKQCGISGKYGDPSEAFMLLHYECICQNYSMGRQLGYLLGCGNHEHQDGRVNRDNDKARGYFYDSEDGSFSFTTIMGYTDDWISCKDDDFNMIPYWSNPNITFNGVAVGDQNHNEAAQINIALKFVSVFRIIPSVMKTGPLQLTPYARATLSAKRKCSVESISAEAQSEVRVKAEHITIKKSRFGPGSKAYFGL